MVNFDVIECEITFPSSKIELNFVSKIERMQKSGKSQNPRRSA